MFFFNKIATFLNLNAYGEDSIIYRFFYYNINLFIKIAEKNQLFAKIFQSIYKKYLDWPKLVLIHPGTECNRDCEYCYEKSLVVSQESLSLEFYKKILKKLKKMGTTQIQILGGEPLMYEHFYELMAILNRDDFDVMLYTNGILFNSNTIKRLKKFGQKLTIAFSLESEEIKGGKNNFNLSLNNMLEARRKGLNVKCFIVVTKKNYRYIPKLLEEVVFKHNIFPVFARYMPCGTEKIDEKYKLSATQWNKILKIQKSLYVKMKKINIGKLSALVRGCGCSDYFDSIHITTDGKVSPCEYVMNSIVLGDLRKEKIEDIWEKYKKNRKIWNKTPQECEKCKHKHFCTGGRKSYSYILKKSFNTKDPLCKGDGCPLAY